MITPRAGTSLSEAFASARRAGRRALIGYLPAGFPDGDTFVDVVRAAAGAGLDVLELGLPVADPYLDGPVIQAALSRQRAAGVTLPEALALACRVRRAAGIPVVAMGYGKQLPEPASALVQALAERGIDGVLLPDLDEREFEALAKAAAGAGVAAVAFASADLPEEALQRRVAACGGFVYVQSGARRTGTPIDPGEAGMLVRRVDAARAGRPIPLAVGFGIRGPGDVRAVAELPVDGVIVGTALVEAAASSTEALRRAVRRLAEAATGR
ncbi:tryptophan synthase subunit alpha [Carboxydochorda subterranea]|uniref:Tryptophan synthase alpha chain n=1 Tax=Carboxydichorda subterranea TaxID=3109565 RepID=A0ABZ1BWK6_9FIRM|nr:tryptophan synthase subunit alpha [Limnochorda sp. L945t]WRP17184.1 tryptophan synthase subunit alpha [Limnochorda sp. L945t]